MKATESLGDPTWDENAISSTTDAALTLRALTGVAGLRTKEGSVQGVSTLFTRYVREKTFGMTLTALENALFMLSKDRFDHSTVIKGGLKAFSTLHPLVALVATSRSPTSIDLVEKEYHRVVSDIPGSVWQYKWTIKALQFLNDLALKWGLLTVHQFTHRFRPLQGTIVRDIQLGECSRLADCCFLPDLLFLAAAPNKDISDSIKLQCQHVRLMAEQLIDILISINREVDFTQTHEVSDFLFRSGRIAPQRTMQEAEVTAMEKHEIASRLHVHLLSLPQWWKCECMYSEEDRVNQLMRMYLKHFCKEYCELERMTSS